MADIRADCLTSPARLQTGRRNRAVAILAHTDFRLRGTDGMMKLGLMMNRLAPLLLILLFAAPARAAQCGGDFNVFLSAMARDAQAAGVPRSMIDQAFAGVTIDPAVLAFDRRQHGTFRMSFER